MNNETNVYYKVPLVQLVNEFEIGEIYKFTNKISGIVCTFMITEALHDKDIVYVKKYGDPYINNSISVFGFHFEEKHSGFMCEISYYYNPSKKESYLNWSWEKLTK